MSSFLVTSVGGRLSLSISSLSTNRSEVLPWALFATSVVGSCPGKILNGLPGTIVSIGKILIGSARTIESLSIDPESIFVLSVEHMFQVGLF